MKRQILPQSVTVQKVFLAFSKCGAIIIEIFKRKSVEKAHISAIFREKERKNMRRMAALALTLALAFTLLPTAAAGALPSYVMRAPKMTSK